MIRPFKSFLAEQKELILEKVSRTELKKAMSDPNVTIGIEFEFILDDTSPYDISSLMNQYERFVSDVNNFAEVLLDLANDYYNEYIGDGIGDAIVNLQAKIDEEEEELEEMKNNDADQDLQYEIETLEGSIKMHKDELDEMVNIQSNPNIDNHYQAIEYINEYGDLYSGEALRPDEYINENMEYAPFPELPYDLKELYDRHGYYNRSSFYDALWGMINDAVMQEDAGTIVDNFLSDASIENPEEMDITGGADPEEIIENYEHWDELPFTNYLLNDYGGSANDWRIVPDASLPEGGVEVISPPLPLKKGLKMMMEMFEFIKDRGRTNRQCGMHVNMSYKGKNLANDVDKLKLMLFMDEGWVYKHFEDREDNRYAKSVLDELRNLNLQRINTNDVRNINKMFDKFTSLIMIPVQKFLGINYSNTIDEGDLKSQRIEFRYLGGYDYHTKSKRIVNGIGRFAHYLRVALNPDEKRKEYIKKLLRLKAKHDEKRGGELPNISNALLSRGEIIDGYDLHKSDDIVSRIEKNKFLRSTAGMKPLNKFKFLGLEYKYLNRIPKSIEPIIRGEEKFYIKYGEDK